MKINRLLLLGIVLAGIFAYVSCRKLDSRSENISVNELEAKFFNSHTPVEPLVLALNKYLQRENNKYHFVEKVVKQIGFPRWDKAIIVYGPGTSHRGAADSANLTYVPFVRDSQNFVNACLLIQTFEADTTYEYLCDWQYAEYGFDTASGDWNARDIFHIFSALDKEVFDRSEFRIVDERLLSAQEVSAIDDAGLVFDSVEVHYTLSSSIQGQGRNSLVMPVTFCEDVVFCIAFCDQFKGNKSTSSGGCCFEMVGEICTTEWVWIPSGGGGGGNPPGGGGGTGGGGNPPGGGGPPECGNGNPQRSNLLDPCGPGWIPIPDPGGGGSPPPNDSTIAENLKKMYLKALNTPDSLHTKAQQDSIERTFTFVRTGTDTVVMWIRTGNSHSSSPTLSSHSFAIFHTHQEDDPVGESDKNQCFDGPDIYKLYKNRVVDGYPLEVSIITTRDYLYAAVITDPIKFRDYIRGICGSTQNIAVIADKLDSLHVAAMNNCSTQPLCNYQKKTELGVLSITANNNSSISGIKIFRSPRQNINFTLLIP